MSWFAACCVASREVSRRIPFNCIVKMWTCYIPLPGRLCVCVYCVWFDARHTQVCFNIKITPRKNYCRLTLTLAHASMGINWSVDRSAAVSLFFCVQKCVDGLPNVAASHSHADKSVLSYCARLARPTHRQSYDSVSNKQPVIYHRALYRSKWYFYSYMLLFLISDLRPMEETWNALWNNSSRLPPMFPPGVEGAAVKGMSVLAAAVATIRRRERESISE